MAITREILNSHPLTTLKKEVAKTNIKGYSKMKKAEVVELMMKNKDKFGHIRKKGEASAPASKPKKEVTKPKKEVTKPKPKSKADVKVKKEKIKKLALSKFTNTIKGGEYIISLMKPERRAKVTVEKVIDKKASGISAGDVEFDVKGDGGFYHYNLKRIADTIKRLRTGDKTIKDEDMFRIRSLANFITGQADRQLGSEGPDNLNLLDANKASAFLGKENTNRDKNKGEIVVLRRGRGYERKEVEGVWNPHIPPVIFENKGDGEGEKFMGFAPMDLYKFKID